MFALEGIDVLALESGISAPLCTRLLGDFGAEVVKIERPGEEEPFIPSAARMGAVFVHGAACTIHKAQGSQWPRVQVFAPDLYAAYRAGQEEAGLPLWKRLAYVAITRAEEQLVWVTRYVMARPAHPIGTAGTLPPAEGPAPAGG